MDILIPSKKTHIGWCLGVVFATYIASVTSASVTTTPLSTKPEPTRLPSVGTLSSTPRALTLDQALKEAVTRNPRLRAAKQDWIAACERIPQAGALDDPKLMLGYEFALDPFGRREMPLDMKKWTTDRAIVGFSWMISPSRKRRQRTELAVYEAAVAAANYRRMVYEIRRKAAQAYAEVFYGREKLRIADQNAATLRQIYEVALHRFHASEMTQAELTKIEIESLRAESAQTEAQLAYDRAVASFNGLRFYPPTTPVTVSDIPGVKLPTRSATQLLQRAARNNPELEELRNELEARGVEVVLAELQRMPDFELSLPDVRTLSQMLMIGMTLPFFNRARIDAAIREAEARREAALARLHGGESDVGVRLLVAISMITDAERIIADYGARIESKTSGLLELQLQNYAVDREDLLNVLDTQRMLLDIQQLVARARADRLVGVAELEEILGEPLMPPTLPSLSVPRQPQDQRYPPSSSSRLEGRLKGAKK
ncbi:MAG: TolC family protein [Candidatus Sumerlaea chitinivorans]|nr:TolC family protein [Candidatus Sumerlaea chitinivorans]